MSNSAHFQSQLASIMEVLANAAVAEICQLVDDGYAVLRLEMSRTQRENQALKSKLRLVEVRSREKSVKSLPHSLSSCTKESDHVEEQPSPSPRRNEGPVVLGDKVVCEETIDMLEHPELVVVKEEKLEEELRECGSKHSRSTGRRITAPQSNVGVDCQPMNAQTVGVEFDGEKGDSGNQRPQLTADGQAVPRQLMHIPECVTYPRAQPAAPTLSPIGGRDPLDPSCSYSAETHSGDAFESEPPMIHNEVVTLRENEASSALLGWKREAAVVDALKMEAGMPWNKARVMETSLAARYGADISGKDREGVQLGNGTNFCSQSTISLRESDSSEGCKSSEADANGFDTSFDDIFSPSEMAGLQTHNRDDGCSGDGPPSCPYAGNDGFGSPVHSTPGGSFSQTDCSAVRNAVGYSPTRETSQYTKGLTWGRNSSAAPSVTNSFCTYTSLKLTREYILGRNRLAAPSVVSASPSPATSSDI
ncbi:hypothetical protein UPYG_G00046890 [Umbra pygmaea]|uniref:Uncharacterized protein n=1 Tax=Umbra pygmaea TaxID=75934 RepID=A0ABD0XR62_UMBPY